jgi:pyruvate dehydrogenase E1 component beta subunit
MDYDTILTSVKKTNRLVVLEEACLSRVVRRLLILFKNVLLTFLMQFNVLQLLILQRPPVLLKEWLPNAD